jgi:hypothetical protein
MVEGEGMGADLDLQFFNSKKAHLVSSVTTI